LVACDLFVMPDTKEGSHPEQRLSAFKANYLRFHPSLPDIRVGLSSQLTADRANAFRFIHVDGSHDYEEVANDIRIVRRLATSDAVVVFDDVRTREWPGVAAAVWSAVASETIVPFAMTNKLYCTVEDHPEYLEGIVRFARGNRSVSTSIHPIAGHHVVALSPTPEPRGKRFIREVTPPVLLRLAKRMLQ
jgi:Methyltransferase domain